MGGWGVGGWGCTPIVIGRVGWRHDDVIGLNFYISGCDPSIRHHFWQTVVAVHAVVSSFEVLNKIKRALDFKRRYVCCIF